MARMTPAGARREGTRQDSRCRARTPPAGALVLVGQAAPGVDQVGPARERAGQRLRPAPPGDPAVVAERSTSGTSQPRNVGRPGVLRVLEQPVGEGLVVGRRVVAHDAGHEPGDRLEHDHRGHLAAGQHVVADRQLAVDEVVAHPLVDALVAAAQQREPVRARPARGPRAWSNRAPAGAEQEQRPRRLDRLDRGEHRLGHQHHAGAAAERRVVDRAVRVGRRRRAGRARARRAARRSRALPSRLWPRSPRPAPGRS